MLGTQRAQDAAQETYAKALQKFPTLQDRPAARGWLFSIATHHCLDVLRTRGESPLEDWEKTSPADTPDPSAGLLGQAILAGVAPRPRSLLVLRHYLQLSYLEIAGVLEMPVDQVGVALLRARAEALKFARQRGLTRGL
jgi:RNA polymerase sigma-70 factor (ECF subfamily)